MTTKPMSYPAAATSPYSTDITKQATAGAWIAAIAAACWTALGVESILRPWQANYRDALVLVPFGLTAIALVFVHAVQRARGGRTEATGYYCAITASVLAFLGAAGVMTGRDSLQVLVFPWGALLWMIGLTVFGIGTLIAKTLPKYVGIAILLLEPGSLVTGLLLSPLAPVRDHGSYTAGVEKGLAMALVAIGMRSLRRN